MRTGTTLLTLLLAVAAHAAPRLNVLVFVADDQRPDTIHALGNPAIDTPHLDALVRAGTTFCRAITAYPICNASRTEMLTGCTAFRTGVPYGPRPTVADRQLVTWPEAMRRAGYRTWHVGKWHVDGTPQARGFEATRGWYGSGPRPADPGVDHAGRPVTGYVGWQFHDDDGTLRPELGVGLTPEISARFADAAIDVIKRQAVDARPFFLMVNFTAPHDPRLLPPGSKRRYDPAALPLPGNFLPEHPFDHGNAGGRDEVLLPVPRTAAAVCDELAAYYAVLTHLDAQVGRVLAALETTGQAQRTLVIYTADHGLALGSHGLMGKQNMYEHTLGVPLVLRGPGIAAGARRDAQCYLRDLYPSVCELTGVTLPKTVEARSFVPALHDERAVVHPYTVAYFADSQRMIRTARWKLVHYPRVERWQLFDLAADTLELVDLIDDPAHAATRAELREWLRGWQREHGDPLAQAAPVRAR